jgi:carboxypeptidase Taq
MLQAAELQNDGSDPVLAANLREFRYQTDRATRLPVELVARASEASSLAKQAWAEARKKSDFSIFRDHLETMVDIAREKADHWGYATEPYDALVEGYERGADTAKLSSRLDPLRDPLRELAAQAVARSDEHPVDLPDGPYPVDAQRQLNREVAESVGFDFEAGRIDTVTHPFCTGLGPHDTRLTTRYRENDFTDSLFGVLHESGHGLYDQGLPAPDIGLPSGNSVSLGIHESQSRLWENHVGGSRAFWERWLPRAAELFPCLAPLSLDDFLAAIRRAEFSCIRVEADEATYDLHILLRFDLERRVIRGELAIDDIPGAWNDGFRELFGFVPPDDANGCLQDIHWAMGGFGYFATYSLGNINAAQLCAAARLDPAVSSACDNADYTPLLAWMRKRIHRHGSVHFPDALIRQATGADPSPADYLAHLKRRYL